MSGEDIIVGKTVALAEDPSGAMQRFQKRDCSLALRQAESGVVDQVLVTTNEHGQKFVKIRVRTICIPQVGESGGCCPVRFWVLMLETHDDGCVPRASAHQCQPALTWIVIWSE